MLKGGHLWSTIFLSFLYFLSPSLCQYDKVCTYETYRRGVHPQGACGDKLADILEIVCNNKSTRERKDKIVRRNMIKQNFTTSENLLPLEKLRHLGIIKPHHPSLNSRRSPWKSVIKKFLSNKEKALAFLSGDLHATHAIKRASHFPYVKRNGDTNIVCECCYHSCTVEEFEGYCA
ncbi:con-Ins Im1-like [Saccostrea echinata]|uniref:con-Ins Im1-like n=1 Tax=Saccostrea echinata TaxID=191078 RepID=UPI002A7F5C8E|nr:con-Ins Im1-like [Saccostrea echinata]